MAKRPDLTRYQKGIVNRYYLHRGTIVITRLQEIVSDLYLAEGKRADQLWTRAEKAVRGLKTEPPLPGSLVDPVFAERDVAGLARLVEAMDNRS